MRIYPATIRSYCFLHSPKSFAKAYSVKTAKEKKKTASNAQATHEAQETAPQVYCQQRYKMQVNATNHTRKNRKKIRSKPKTANNNCKTITNRYIFTSQLLKPGSMRYSGDKWSIQSKQHLFHYRIYKCHGLGIRVFQYLLKLTAALSRTSSVVSADSAAGNRAQLN